MGPGRWAQTQDCGLGTIGLGLGPWARGPRDHGPGPGPRTVGPGDHGPQGPMGPRAAWAPDNGPDLVGPGAQTRAWAQDRVPGPGTWSAPGPGAQAWAWATEKARQYNENETFFSKMLFFLGILVVFGPCSIKTNQKPCVFEHPLFKMSIVQRFWRVKTLNFDRGLNFEQKCRRPALPGLPGRARLS